MEWFAHLCNDKLILQGLLEQWYENLKSLSWEVFAYVYYCVRRRSTQRLVCIVPIYFKIFLLILLVLLFFFLIASVVREIVIFCFDYVHLVKIGELATNQKQWNYLA